MKLGRKKTRRGVSGISGTPLGEDLTVICADVGVSSPWCREQGGDPPPTRGLSSVERGVHCLSAVVGIDLSLSALIRILVNSKENWNAVSSFCSSIMLLKEAAERK